MKGDNIWIGNGNALLNAWNLITNEYNATRARLCVYVSGQRSASHSVRLLDNKRTLPLTFGICIVQIKAKRRPKKHAKKNTIKRIKYRAVVVVFILTCVTVWIAGLQSRFGNELLFIEKQSEEKRQQRIIFIETRRSGDPSHRHNEWHNNWDLKKQTL